MDKRIKKKWVTALRSGKYKQGRGQLYDRATGKYCVLGVLAKQLKLPVGRGVTAGPTQTYDALDEILGYRVVNWLVARNDGRGTRPKSFKWLANCIEKNL